MQRSCQYHLIESRSQGELEEKRPQERTDQQLCYPESKGNTKAMYKAKKNKRVFSVSDKEGNAPKLCILDGW